MSFPSVVELASVLCAKPSVTPDDAGCQIVIQELLEKQGFQCQSLIYNKVSNLWATHGSGAPFLLFLGHTDVVPAGDLSQWQSPPFEPTIRDHYLYARGVADMKGCVAASTLAVANYANQYPDHPGTIAMLLTSDEEGPAIDGVQRVIDDFLQSENKAIDYCVVTEPTCDFRLGDTLKIGRRGSLSAKLTISGVQGHVAYPHLAENPVFKAIDFIKALRDECWDKGNEDFDPSTLQISQMHSGVGADNVIPPNVVIHFNVRYGTVSTPQMIKQRIRALLKQHGIGQQDYQIEWNHSAHPYLSSRDSELVKSCLKAMTTYCDLIPKISTSGGTSDGRFMAKYQHPISQKYTEVIEFGPLNKTIHQTNECVLVEDLITLEKIYFSVIENMFEGR